MKNAAVLFHNILLDMIHWYILHNYDADHRCPYAQQQNHSLTYHTDIRYIHMMHMIHLYDTDILFYKTLQPICSPRFCKVKYLFLNFK